MRGISPFKAKLAASPLPTGWLSFYANILLPVLAAFFSVITIVMLFTESFMPFLFAYSVVIVYGALAALFWLTFAGLRSLSRSGFVLNKILIWIFGAFVALYMLGASGIFLSGTAVFLGFAFGAVWIIANLIYFSKRKALFDQPGTALAPQSGHFIASRKEFSQTLLTSGMRTGYLRFFVLWRLPVSILYVLFTIGYAMYIAIPEIVKNGFESFYSLSFLLTYSVIKLAFLVLLCLAYVHMQRLSPRGYKFAVALTIVESFYNLTSTFFGLRSMGLEIDFLKMPFILGGLVLLVLNLPYLEKRKHLFIHGSGKNSGLPHEKPVEKAVEEIV